MLRTSPHSLPQAPAGGFGRNWLHPSIAVVMVIAVSMMEMMGGAGGDSGPGDGSGDCDTPMKVARHGRHVWLSLLRCSAALSSHTHSGCACLICPHGRGCWGSVSQASSVGPRKRSCSGLKLPSVWQRGWGCQAPGVTAVLRWCVVDSPRPPLGGGRCLLGGKGPPPG